MALVGWLGGWLPGINQGAQARLKVAGSLGFKPAVEYENSGLRTLVGSKQSLMMYCNSIHSSGVSSLELESGRVD